MMLRFLIVLLACLAPAPATSPGDPKLLKALDAWLKNYKPENFGEKAKFDLTRDRDIEKDSVLKANDVLPKGLVGRLTTRRELEIMLDLAAKADDGETMLRVLAFAAAGQDQRKYNREMAPHLVRSLGQAAAIKMQGASAREALLKIAGAVQGDKAVKAAALRAVGALRDPAHRALLEQQLGAAEPFVRQAAADGLRALAAKESFEALSGKLAHETSPEAAEAIAAALRAIATQHAAAIGDSAKHAAAEAAVAALGKTGSWRADVTLIDFLELFRSSAAIPALIDVLERFQKNLEQVKAGKVSGLLQHRAQDALVSLSGAYFPADKPAEWRAWWEKVRSAGFQVAEKKPVAPGGTVAGFFGVPVRGTRVLFVVDLSGSMEFTMTEGGGTTAGKDVPDQQEMRINVARRELAAAIERMPEYSSFGVIAFAGEAWDWEAKDGEPGKVQFRLATKANKDEFKTKFIEKRMLPVTPTVSEATKRRPGTNIWAGLALALDARSEVTGARYEVPADEVFLLSDGLPSVGEVLHPKEILDKTRDKNELAKLRLNSIYISGHETPDDLQLIERYGMNGGEFMKQLAEQNGGAFVEKK